jgi:hypothetical protein
MKFYSHVRVHFFTELGSNATVAGVIFFLLDYTYEGLCQIHRGQLTLVRYGSSAPVQRGNPRSSFNFNVCAAVPFLSMGHHVCCCVVGTVPGRVLCRTLPRSRDLDRSPYCLLACQPRPTRITTFLPPTSRAAWHPRKEGFG